MNIIPSSKLFEACLSPILNQLNVECKQLFFNKRNTFVISKAYLQELERTISDPDMFKSLAIELIDGNQILSDNIPPSELIPEFENVASNHRRSNCFPICIDEDFDHPIPQLIRLANSKKFNSDWIIRELACHGMFRINYFDFSNNREISGLFSSIFSLFTLSEDIYIFNRYVEYNYLDSLKGKRIFYYSFLKNPGKNIQYFIEGRDEIRMKLGKRVDFQVTGN